MNFSVIEDDAHIVLTLQGDLDMPNIKSFKESSFDITKKSDKDLTLDFTNVSYIDSSGIGILLTLHKLQKSKGKSFRIINCSEHIAKIFSLSSLNEVLCNE